MSLKRALGGFLAAPAVCRVLARGLMRGRAVVFGLHQFGDLPTRMGAHSLERLERHLDFVARSGFRTIGLGELLDIVLGQRAIPEGRGPLVCFTVDDGYESFLQAAPIFRQYNCPVTVFLTSGFVDGECWFWWDQVEYMIDRAEGRFVELTDAAGQPVTFYLHEGEAGLGRAYGQIVAFLKTLPEPLFASALKSLSNQLGVAIPSAPPHPYRAMTWAQVRECQALGASFAPHTVTHPILSNTSDEAARYEIAHSYHRLRAELDEVVPVFAYPNGDPGSFGAREMRLIEEAGLQGAVTTVPDYWRISGAATTVPSALPRFSYPDDGTQFAHIMAGAERVKRSLRRWKAPNH